MGRYEAKDGTIIPSAHIRAYIYALMVAASPVAIYYGIATLEEAGLWIAFGGVALGVTNGLALANTGKRDPA
jgi:hypothetical protein